jgi:hypothetical protein
LIQDLFHHHYYKSSPSEFSSFEEPIASKLTKLAVALPLLVLATPPVLFAFVTSVAQIIHSF